MDGIEELKSLLCIGGSASEEEIIKSFDRIAELLINHAIIRRGERSFRIEEIEFYFYNNQHRDLITYPRITKPMQWYRNAFFGMEEKKYCYKYPHPAVTTDCVIFGFDGNDIKVLLIERGIEPYKGKWAFPGGFLNMDETAAEGALRELKEETGLENAYIEQFNTYSEPDRDPRERVITIAHYALVRIQEVKGGDDAAKAQWFPIDEVPQLAFDHDKILRDAMRKLRERIHFEPIGFELLPEKFTMKDLQILYESILDVKFDRRNFAKKMMHYELLNQLDETVRPTAKRDALLYSFNKENYELFKKKGFQLEF